MIRNLRRFAAVVFAMSYSALSAQTVCNYAESSSGDDNINYVEFNSFDCIDTVTNSYITDARITFEHAGSSWSCPNSYYFNLEVDGTVYADNLCGLDSVSLLDYGVDVNNMSGVKILAQDGNSWADQTTIISTLDLYYIVTTCPPPSALVTDNIEPTTTDLSWTSNGSENLWNLELVNITVGDTATGNATTSGVTINNNFELLGLIPETTYEVYVQSDCGPFNSTPQSIWSIPVTFTTPPTCLPLGDITIDSIGDVFIDLSWAQAGSETSWELEIINLEAVPPDTFTFTPSHTVTDNSPHITGLVPESFYQVIVRANCGLIDGPSAWTNNYWFTTLPTCQAPLDLTVDYYSDDAITYSWTSIDTEPMWYVEYVNITLGQSFTGIASDSTYTNSYTAQNLDGNSVYEVYVSAACGGTDGNSEWVGPEEVTTMCSPTSMPITEGFNTWIPECFEVDLGDGEWTPYVTSGDTIAARARNSWGNFSEHRILQAPIVDMDQAALLTFKWSHDDSNQDTLKVILSDDDGLTWSTIWSVTGPDFESNDGASSSAPGSYLTEYLLIDNSYVGSEVMVALDYASPLNITNDYIFIDSMAITALPACNTPYDLAVDSVQTNSVDMSFTVAGSGATLYEIEIVESTIAPTGIATHTATGTPFNSSGLISGTNYKAFVRTMCGTDSTDWVGPVTFTTLCAPIADYITSFEGLNTGDPMNCWTFIDSTTSTSAFIRVENSSWNANTGTNYLHFESFNLTGPDVLQFASLPEVTSLATQDHRLRFYAKEGNNDGNTLVIGTITDPNDISTFTAMDSITLTSTYTQYTFNFDVYTGLDNYVAIQSIPGTAWADSYLDDIEWHEIPNCFPPTDVTVDSTSTTSVSITVDSIGTFGTEWLLELVDVSGMNPTVLYTGTSPSFTVNGLEPSTIYEVTISTNCTNAVSESTSFSFQTDCAPIDDFFTDFESLQSNDTAICWTHTVEHNLTTTWGLPSVRVNASSWSSCEGSRSIRMSSANDFTADILFVTPELSAINDGTHLLTFEAKNNSTFAPASPFEVGTMTDPNDPSTFTAIFSSEVSGMNCDSIAVPFLSYTGIGQHIAIKFNPTSTNDNLYIDNMRWEEGPDCALPVGFSFDNLSHEEVTLDWLNTSPDTVWHLELVNQDDTLDLFDSIPTDTAIAHPYLITGLNENTEYVVHLSNPCDTIYADTQIEFTTPWANNIGINSILSPVESGCNISDSSQIEIEIENFGGLPATGFPVELSWDSITFINVGTFMDTIQPGATATFTLNGYYDFSAALDSIFWVQTALTGDSVISNDIIDYSVTNLGNMWIDVQVNTGNYGGEVWWEILDTVNGVIHHQTSTGAGYSSYSTYNTAVCVYEDGNYIMNAWDIFDDGWNGGTYSITRCGGIIIANNDGNEVTNGIGGISGSDLEVQEGFHVEACPDNDLAVTSIDGLASACGLGVEMGNVTLMNFGNFDVAANGATAQYMFNNSGLWINFWNFDTGLASQQDTVMELPSIDMSLTGEYNIAVRINFTLDEDTTSNFLDINITSVPTLTVDSTTFNSGNGGWTSEIGTGVANSWEYGIPTTTVAGNSNDQEVWATNLSGDIALNEQSYLYSPCYDFSSYTNDVEVEFDFVRTNNNHSFQLQKSSNGGTSWQWIWTASSNTVEWTNKSILVTGLSGESDVRFRWRLNSSWNTPIEGFAFDNWEAFEHVPYTDPSLSDLAVAGNTVTDPVTFDPTVFNYAYEVPYGSTNYNVTASTSAPFITSLSIDQVSSLPDTAFINVIAEDTAYTATYSVIITEGPAATDATLQSLEVSGSSVPGFHPDTLCYTLTYPFGSAFTPSVSALENDPNATVVTNNVAIPGTATIIVTAEDGITTNTYCINYEIESQSSNALLSDLQVDLVTVSGFTANIYTYYVELPNGTTIAPTVIGITDDNNATVTLTQATNVPDTAVVEVLAEDGVTTLTYYVIFTVAPSDNANLLDLTINGGTVTGFDAATLTYNVVLDFGTPLGTVNIGAITEDITATVVIIDATIVPGTTIITITAEDGTILTYYINWTYATAAADATLDSLSTTSGYFCIIANPDTLAQMVVSPVDEYEYNLTVGIGATSLANLTVVPNDPNATYILSGSATVAPYGDIIITVTAEDGTTQEMYTVHVISENCSIGLDEAILGQITVSPNPSNGIFYVATPADLINYNITVVDQIGKIVYKESVVEASMEKVMDLSTLPAGMYNLRISTANDHIVKRISIIK